MGATTRQVSTFHAVQRTTDGLALVKADGSKVWVHRLSPSASYSQVATFGEVEVEGRKTITRPVGPGVATMPLTLVLGNVNLWGRDRDVEADLAKVLAIAANAIPFYLSGHATYLETGKWWRVVGSQVDVTHRTEYNRAARAVVEWDLVEYTADRLSYAPKAAAPSRTTSTTKKATTRTYTVRAGDYPWKIAQNLLGNGQRWKEIYELNKSKLSNMNDIQIGTVLKVPLK